MHSSRMRTARVLTVWQKNKNKKNIFVGGSGPGEGVSGPGGGVSEPGGVWSRGGGGSASVHAGIPPVDRHTPVNLLPCPKLRLRAVMNVDCTGTQRRQVC